MPGYGPVPQGGSARPGRAAVLDLLAVRNVPRVAAPLARAARYGHGLGNPLPHDRITGYVVYLSILCQASHALVWHKMESQTPKRAGDLFSGVLSLNLRCVLHSYLSTAGGFLSAFQKYLDSTGTLTDAGKTRGKRANLDDPLDGATQSVIEVATNRDKICYSKWNTLYYTMWHILYGFVQ